MKRLLSLTLCLLMAVASFGHSFEVDGIYYKITSSSAPYEVAVTYRGGTYSLYSNEYTGDVIIPSTVTYEGKNYSVTSISNGTFSDCSSLTSIEIPSSVTSISSSAFFGCSGLTSINVADDNLTYDSRNNCDAIIATSTNTLITGCKTTVIPNSVTIIGNDAFNGCSGLNSITIPESVTSIGNNAFSGCSGLTSVTIPNSVTSIGRSAFEGCTGLTSVTIGNNVTIIGNEAFYCCSGLTSITIPNRVTSIGNHAFFGCSGLTSIKVEDSNQIYDSRDNCNAIIETASNNLIKGCNTTVIPSSVTSIGDWALYDCKGLTSITIPSSVTSIGLSAFYNCSGLTEISSHIIEPFATVTNCWYGVNKSIPLYVKVGTKEKYLSTDGWKNFTNIIDNIPLSIGDIFTVPIAEGIDMKFKVMNETEAEVYSNAIDRTYTGSLTIPESVEGYKVTGIDDDAFYNCGSLTSIDIPNSVTSIGSSAFYGCRGLTSIDIPNSVTTIGSSAFYGCSGLTSVTIGNSVTYISNSTFSNCNNITSIIIGNSVTGIGVSAFKGCTGLTSVTLPNSVTSIGSYAFDGCTALTSVTIPNSVTTIGSSAFLGCSKLTSVTLPGNILSVYSSTFPSTAKLYVSIGSKTLLALWNGSYENVYETGTQSKQQPSSMLSCSSTQTTVTINKSNKYSAYTYSYVGKNVGSDGITITGLRPGQSHSFTVTVSKDNLSYSFSQSFSTAGLKPMVNSSGRTASSLQAIGSYTKGDAVVTKTVIKCNGKEVEGNSIALSGLNPNTSYNVEYTITVTYGSNNQNTTTFTGSSYLATQPLTLTTEQPKVISSGNVIVAATTNVDNEETNVGFEWRREDWSDTFASQTGAAVLYDGTMEGYIRNMNAEKLWSYRAYYLSDSGTYYYGDWVGIDPSNTSYFEPTVRTYANISVKGNTALVKGYALNGTDKIKVQGFKYWKTANKGNSLDIDREGDMLATAIPADAITKTVDIVGSGQQLMNATLEGLDYDATYHCVAFATTTENETFYGEEQMFTTESITGIEGVKESAAGSSKAITVVAYYDLNGKQLSQPQKGLNILKMSDGTTRKVVK